MKFDDRRLWKEDYRHPLPLFVAMELKKKKKRSLLLLVNNVVKKVNDNDTTIDTKKN